MAIIMRRCSGPCGLEYPEVFFRRKGPDISSPRHSRCKGCEVTARTNAKNKDRHPAKARATIKHHAKKAIDKGWAVSISDFCFKFGWDVRRIANNFRHAYSNGCSYCFKKYKEMGHGLWDITIDIVDRKQRPFYTVNTKFCCQTCNREKGVMSPDEWAEQLVCWAQWRAWEALKIPAPQYEMAV